MSSQERCGNDSQRITVRGHEVHLVDTRGDGPVLVIVHGSPISSFAFREQIAALRATHRVIAPDLLNFGCSGGPEQGASFVDQAEMLEALLHLPALDVDLTRGLSLAVHDWGGPAAIGGLALAHQRGRPIRVRRLMFMNTSVRPTFKPPWYWVFQHRRAGKLLIEQLDLFGLGLPVLLRAAARDREVRRVHVTPLRRQRRTRRTAARLEHLDGYRELMLAARAALVPIEAPTLVFWGVPEPYFGEQDIDYLTEICPHSEVLRVRGAGHFSMEDAPEELTSAMLRFFGADD